MNKITQFFAIFTLVLYLSSIFLPFTDDFSGWALFLGAMLSQFTIIYIPVTFPVWANFTFIYALSILKEDKSIALGLATATTILMALGLILMFGSDGFGWGAVIWFLSGVMLLVSTLVQNYGYKNLITFSALSLFVLVIYSAYALSEEQKKYATSNLWHDMSNGILLSGRINHYNKSKKIVPPLNQVKSNDHNRVHFGDKRVVKKYSFTISENDLIEIDDYDVNYHLKKYNGNLKYSQDSCELIGKKVLPFQKPLFYLKDGYYWRQYSYHYSIDSQFSVGVKSDKKPNYIYSIKNEDRKYSHISLKRVKDNSILYEQMLLSNETVLKCQYEPAVYANEINSIFLSMSKSLDDDDHLHLKFEDEQWKTDILSQSCDFQALTQENVYQWEDKRIDFQELDLVHLKTLCSDHYLAFIHLTKDDYYSKELGLSSRVQLKILRKNDFTPLGCSHFSFDISRDLLKGYYEGKVHIRNVYVHPIPNNCAIAKIELDNGMVFNQDERY